MRNLILSTVLSVLAATTVGQAQPYYSRYYPPQRRDYLDRADRLVRYWYRSYLRRAADPEEVQMWGRQLRRGANPAAVLSSILASREYLDYAGGTRADFIKQLLLDVGHHEPSGREVRYKMMRTRNLRRGQIAYNFLLRYPNNWRPGLRDAAPDEDNEDWE